MNTETNNWSKAINWYSQQFQNWTMFLCKVMLWNSINMQNTDYSSFTIKMKMFISTEMILTRWFLLSYNCQTKKENQHSFFILQTTPIFALRQGADASMNWSLLNLSLSEVIDVLLYGNAFTHTSEICLYQDTTGTLVEAFKWTISTHWFVISNMAKIKTFFFVSI